MKVIINPAYVHLTDFIQNLTKFFLSEGEVVYEGRNLLKRYQVQNVDLVVKSFKVPFFVNRFVYTYIRKSKARRSYEYAFEILRRGGNTSQPIAYIEQYSRGLLTHSFYISAYIEGAETMRKYMAAEVLESENILDAFTRFTVLLHEKGILHLDFSPGNVLMKLGTDNTLMFYLVDINRLKFCRISEDAAYHNLERLCMSSTISTWIAKRYASIRGYDPSIAVYKINLYSDRFFDSKTYSYVRSDIRKAAGKFKSCFGPLQKYKFYRFIRRFCGCSLFSKREKELYFIYVAVCDLRKVRLKEYQEL